MAPQTPLLSEIIGVNLSSNPLIAPVTLSSASLIYFSVNKVHLESSRNRIN